MATSEERYKNGLMEERAANLLSAKILYVEKISTSVTYNFEYSWVILHALMFCMH